MNLTISQRTKARIITLEHLKICSCPGQQQKEKERGGKKEGKSKSQFVTPITTGDKIGRGKERMLEWLLLLLFVRRRRRSVKPELEVKAEAGL